MNPKIKAYFDNLLPGTIVQVNETKNPELFRESAFDYIDLFGHSIGFINEYQSLIKYHPIPKDGNVNYFYNY
jgi:hypothetical protein